jgi:hypothetical protein
MRWDWEQLQRTPVSVVLEVVAQMREQANRQEQERQAPRRRR